MNVTGKEAMSKKLAAVIHEIVDERNKNDTIPMTWVIGSQCTVSERFSKNQEFHTVLCQIEACLNSRPLIALSNDPENLDVLTPGHFLIGTSLLSIPNSNLIDQNLRYLSGWKMVQQMTQ